MVTYRHFLPSETLTSLATAMKLCGCSHYEWLREVRRGRAGGAALTVHAGGATGSPAKLAPALTLRPPWPHAGAPRRQLPADVGP